VITIPGYVFDGEQSSTYNEAAWHYKGHRSDWIAGLNFYTDAFREQSRSIFTSCSYTQTTTGAFLQNT
jgi:iron complex outermembrane receptor protein